MGIEKLCGRKGGLFDPVSVEAIEMKTICRGGLAQRSCENRRAGGFCLTMSMILLLSGLSAIVGLQDVRAENAVKNPYFAALKADEVNVRKGPGRDYPVLWTYRSLGLPVEVTAAHEHWRRIRDSNGSEGWVYFRLLSRLRMALVSPWQKSRVIVPLRSTQSAGSRIIANLETGVKVRVISCDGQNCFVSLEGFKGYVAQKKLWGVYSGEIIK